MFCIFFFIHWIFSIFLIAEGEFCVKLEDIVSVCHIMKLRDGTVLNLEGLTEDGFNLLEKAFKPVNPSNLITPEPSPGIANCNVFGFDNIIKDVDENEME